MRLGEQRHVCTLSGSLSIRASKGNHTLVHLDAHHYTLVFDQLGEGLAVIRLLVERLMEEDDTANAGVDPVFGGEEELAVKPPVLLCVLCVDALEAFGHAAWRWQETGKILMESITNWGQGRLPVRMIKNTVLEVQNPVDS